MEFDNIQYVQGAQADERDKLGHLVQAATSANQPLDGPIIKGQEETILRLVRKIKELELENEE